MDNNGAMGPASGGSGAQEESKGSETSQSTLYRGYLQFERDNESYEKQLSELCPLAASFNKNPDQSPVNIVRTHSMLVKFCLDHSI